MSAILLAFDDLGLGGIQTKIIDVANFLAKTTTKQIIVLVKNRTEFDRSHLLDKRVRCIFTPTFFPGLVKARYYYLLIILILLIRPKSVLVSLEKTSLFLLKNKPLWSCFGLNPTKLIVNIDIYLPPEQIESTKVLKKYFNQANTVVAVSNDVHSDLKNRIGVTTPPLKLIHNWTSMAGTKIDLKTDRPIDFIFAGRLSEQKQPQLLIPFMKKIIKKTPEAKLQIFGSGELESTLITDINNQKLTKVIEVHPPSHAIHEKLRSAKSLIITSSYEGLPFIALEAIKNGCLVVALNSPGITDLVVDSKTGIVKKTIDELAASWLETYPNQKKRQALITAAYKHVNRHFSEKNCAEFAKLLL